VGDLGKIKLKLKPEEIWWESVDWIHLATDSVQVVVNIVMNFRVP
jgi:hypothetical protein